MSATEQTITADELHEIIMQAENVDRRLELINGEIIEKMPTQLHALIAAFIITELTLYLRTNPIGSALVEARYSLPDDPGQSYIPDISYVHDDKGEIVESGAAPYMPDLAVEVESPGQSAKLLADKAAYYLAHGTKMVWLIYVEKAIVEVLTPDARHLLTGDDIISGGEVLPGLTINVRDVFKRRVNA